MANLKDITDLPVAASAKGLNLIVNDNGAAKQIAADAIGKVKSVNGTQPDANGNIEIEIPEGFSGSWNDLKDKPFYSKTEVVLEKQVIEGFAAENSGLFTADYPCELNISLGDKLSIWFDGESYECTTINLPNAPAEILGFGNPAFMGGPEGPEPFFIIYVGPEQVISIGTGNSGTSHEIGISKEVVHKLDAKYLPEGGGGGGYDLTVKITDYLHWAFSGRPECFVVDESEFKKFYQKMWAGKFVSVALLNCYEYDDEGTMRYVYWALPATFVALNYDDGTVRITALFGATEYALTLAPSGEVASASNQSIV